MWDSVDPVFPFLAVCSVGKLFFAYMNKDKKPGNLRCVGKISKLTLFPVKSMAGISLDNVECTQKGVKYPGEPVFDRTFMVVTGNGSFITARAYPKLATVKPRLERHYLILEAEGIEELKIPKVCLRDTNKPLINTNVFGSNVQGQDCGQAASDWISTVLNKKNFRLIYNMEGILQRPMTDSKCEDLMRFSAKQGDRVVFHDSFPYLMLSQASLDDLNTRLTEKVTMDHFRPNIVIDTMEPYEEDEWDEIWISDVKFTNVRHCERCTMTNVNPEKGVISKDGETLKVLKTYRQHNPSYTDGPIFGVHLVLDSPNGSSINVGDTVYTLPKQQP